MNILGFHNHISYIIYLFAVILINSDANLLIRRSGSASNCKTCKNVLFDILNISYPAHNALDPVWFQNPDPQHCLKSPFVQREVRSEGSIREPAAGAVDTYGHRQAAHTQTSH